MSAFLNSKLSHDFFELRLHAHTAHLPCQHPHVVVKRKKKCRFGGRKGEGRSYTTRHTALHQPMPPCKPPPPTIRTPQTLPTLHAFLRPHFLQKDSRRRMRQNLREKEKVRRFLSYSSTCNSMPSTIAPTPCLPLSVRRFYYVTSLTHRLQVLHAVSEMTSWTNTLYWSMRCFH